MATASEFFCCNKFEVNEWLHCQILRFYVISCKWCWHKKSKDFVASCNCLLVNFGDERILSDE